MKKFATGVIVGALGMFAGLAVVGSRPKRCVAAVKVGCAPSCTCNCDSPGCSCHIMPVRWIGPNQGRYYR